MVDLPGSLTPGGQKVIPRRPPSQSETAPPPPSPSGYARGGPVNKGYLSQNQSFAQGGAVLGRTTNFMKTPDQFRSDKSNATDETFAKGSKGGGDGGGTAAPKAKGKSLPTVKPRK